MSSDRQQIAGIYVGIAAAAPGTAMLPTVIKWTATMEPAISVIAGDTEYAIRLAAMSTYSGGWSA